MDAQTTAGLSESAQRVFAFAESEAVRLNHSYLGSEHLLFGLASEDEGFVGQLLRVLTVTPERIHKCIEVVVGKGKSASTVVNLTPLASRIVDQSYRKATQRGVNEVTPLLLFQSMLESDLEGIGAGVLNALGTSKEELRRKLSLKPV